MYCNNCGKEGHIFKTCKDPIISCGIILLRGIYEPLVFPVNPKNASILMVRRKDSMAYIEFIRGKYNSLDTTYIKKLLSNMTIAEQNRIATETFDALWTALWGVGKDCHSIEFEMSREKFNSLSRKKLVDEARSIYEEPEWGIPKGRRMKGETDLQCGVREFTEETNIPESAYEVTTHCLTETFFGTNNTQYRHVYFIARLISSSQINLKQKFTPMQQKEISAIAWKTFDECKTLIRPHYEERKRVIEEIERIISKL
jgi:8-oxo-dGTP pyrophosphatase MutT (NUDIX family)